MRKFKVLEDYPNSPYQKGESIETEVKEVICLMESFPKYFKEELDTEYYVRMWEGYALSLGQADSYAGKIDHLSKGPIKSFEDKEEAVMFFYKNKQMFSYEDIAKLPLEASQLEFFRKTIEKAVKDED